MFENLRKKNIVETIPKKVILPEIEAMGEPETADEIEIYDEEEEINEPLKEEKVEQEVEEPTEENFDESEIEPDEEYNAYVEKEKI